MSQEQETNWDAYLSTRTTNAYTDRALIQPYLKGDLIEIGCGFGDFAAWCAKDLGCRVSGVDPSGEAVAQARKLWPEGRFEVAGAEALPFPRASFDCAVSLEVVEHLKDPKLFFIEAARVLRPGGFLVVQTPNYPVKRIYDFLYFLMRRKPDMKDDPTHVSPFTFAKMEFLARANGFEILVLQGRNVLGENRLPFLSRLKKGFAARLFAQKMILVARLSPSPSV